MNKNIDKKMLCVDNIKDAKKLIDKLIETNVLIYDKDKDAVKMNKDFYIHICDTVKEYKLPSTNYYKDKDCPYPLEFEAVIKDYLIIALVSYISEQGYMIEENTVVGLFGVIETIFDSDMIIKLRVKKGRG